MHRQSDHTKEFSRDTPHEATLFIGNGSFLLKRTDLTCGLKIEQIEQERNHTHEFAFRLFCLLGRRLFLQQVKMFEPSIISATDSQGLSFPQNYSADAENWHNMVGSRFVPLCPVVHLHSMVCRMNLSLCTSATMNFLVLIQGKYIFPHTCTSERMDRIK